MVGVGCGVQRGDCSRPKGRGSRGRSVSRARSIDLPSQLHDFRNGDANAAVYISVATKFSSSLSALFRNSNTDKIDPKSE